MNLKNLYEFETLPTHPFNPYKILHFEVILKLQFIFTVVLLVYVSKCFMLVDDVFEKFYRAKRHRYGVTEISKPHFFKNYISNVTTSQLQFIPSFISKIFPNLILINILNIVRFKFNFYL